MGLRRGGGGRLLTGRDGQTEAHAARAERDCPLCAGAPENPFFLIGNASGTVWLSGDRSSCVRALTGRAFQALPGWPLSPMDP